MKSEYITLNIYQGDHLVAENTVALVYDGSLLVQASLDDGTPLDPDTMANMIGITVRESSQ